MIISHLAIKCVLFTRVTAKGVGLSLLIPFVREMSVSLAGKAAKASTTVSQQLTEPVQTATIHFYI
jgi:hypothetical protein